jgi:hypothetical protein
MDTSKKIIIGGGLIIVGGAILYMTKDNIKSLFAQVDLPKDKKVKFVDEKLLGGALQKQPLLGSYSRFDNPLSFGGNPGTMQRRAGMGGLDSKKLFPKDPLASGFDKTFVDQPRDFSSNQTNMLLNTLIVTRNKFNPSYDVRGDIPIIPPDDVIAKGGPFGINRSTQGPYAPKKIVRSYVY